MPTAVHPSLNFRRITILMIGIDPHKASHTAVAIDNHEVVLAERLVRSRADLGGGVR